MKNKILVVSILGAFMISAVACGSIIGQKSAESTAPENETAPISTMIDVSNPPTVVDKTEAVVEKAPVAPQKSLPENKTAEQEIAKKSAASIVAAIKTATEDETSPAETLSEAVTTESETITEAEVEENVASAEVTEIIAEPMPFEAEVGLGEFDAYRMNLEASFDGTRNGGQPSAGTLDGVFEVTKNPGAQHWQFALEGDAFNELAMLGGGLDLYKIGGTLYMKNPADGTFIGIPSGLVDSMLPQEMYSPENSIDLPTTATLQPGQEEINGVLSQKYTFTAADMTGDTSKYDKVDGAIWVAVDGNYVVKYQADLSGEFDNLSAGGINLLEAGSISMAYDISDVNGDFTIQQPAGASGINLGALLGALN